MPAQLQSNRPQSNRPGNEPLFRSRPVKAALKFVERTVMICGYMALVTAIIFLITGELARAVPFFALGVLSVYWTWRKLKRLR